MSESVKFRKEYGYGAGAAAAVLAVAYFLAIAPQAQATDSARDVIEQVETTNATMEAKIPDLKAKLAGISEDVTSLQELSAAVPAHVNQPGLYAELDEVARKAGLPGLGTVSLSTPTPVTPVAAPTEGAEPVAADGADDAVQQVLASYDVTMKVDGTREQVLAFLAGLDDAERLSVVGNSTITEMEGVTTLSVTATFFLQQVEVDAIIEQIKTLTAIDAGEIAAEEAPVTEAETEDAPVEAASQDDTQGTGTP